MDKISITFEGRVVHWDVNKDTAIQIMQILVQSLGPAKDGS